MAAFRGLFYYLKETEMKNLEELRKVYKEKYQQYQASRKDHPNIFHNKEKKPLLGSSDHCFTMVLPLHETHYDGLYEDSVQPTNKPFLLRQLSYQ